MKLRGPRGSQIEGRFEKNRTARPCGQDVRKPANLSETGNGGLAKDWIVVQNGNAFLGMEGMTKPLVCFVVRGEPKIELIEAGGNRVGQNLQEARQGQTESRGAGPVTAITWTKRPGRPEAPLRGRRPATYVISIPSAEVCPCSVRPGKTTKAPAGATTFLHVIAATAGAWVCS